MKLHYEFDAAQGADIAGVLQRVRSTLLCVSHQNIIAFNIALVISLLGGTLGCYSYKWAEVLSADAFAKFEENGIFDRATGREFLHAILERGGSQPAAELFSEFRGREPDINALLRHSGIAN